MNDTRLQQAVECVEAALLAADKQAKWLIQDANKLLRDLDDECGGGVPERIDIARAARFLEAAQSNVGHAVAMMVQAREAVKKAQQ